MPNKSNDYIRLDLNSGRLVKQIYVRQNDTVARTICASIVNNGRPVSLENASSVAIRIDRPDDTHGFNGCVVVGNEIQYTLRTTDISVIGTSTAQFEVTYLNQENFTTPIFNIQVFKKNGDDATIKSQNEYTAILGGQAAAELAAANALEYSNLAKGYKEEAEASAESASTYLETVEADKELAQEAATEASTAKTNALTYANNAAASATQAETYKNTAASIAASISTSVSEAEGYADDAKVSEDNAAASARAAATSATSAETYKENAKDFAEEAQNIKDSLQEPITSHILNDDIHVSEADRALWNAGYVLPIATENSLGGVMVDNDTIKIDTDGRLSLGLDDAESEDY